jgi:hypothetical protein
VVSLPPPLPRVGGVVEAVTEVGVCELFNFFVYVGWDDNVIGTYFSAATFGTHFELAAHIPKKEGGVKAFPTHTAGVGGGDSERRMCIHGVSLLYYLNLGSLKNK